MMELGQYRSEHRWQWEYDACTQDVSTILDKSDGERRLAISIFDRTCWTSILIGVMKSIMAFRCYRSRKQAPEGAVPVMNRCGGIDSTF